MSTSKLVHDFMAGFSRANEDGSTRLVNGRLPLFRNFDEDGNRLACPRTLLIESERLDSGEALDKNFRAAAGDEITPERDACEVRFPRVEGYRVELPEERLTARFDDDATLADPPDRRTAPARWGPILVAGSRRRRSRWV